MLLSVGAGCVHVDVSKSPPPDGMALLREVDELESLVKTVKGSARIQARSPKGNGEAPAFIAARAPGEVHLEVLDFFGSPQSVLVADGRHFGLYQRDRATFLHGPLTAASISRLLPVDISAEDLVAILLGRTPRLPVAPQRVEADVEEGAYRVTLVQGLRQQTLWIHPVSKRVLRSVLSGPGGYSLSFEHPVTTAGVPFARKVTFSDASATVVLRWSEEDVQLEGKLDAALFEMQAPEGAKSVEVEPASPAG
jgi:hypothetical protein